MKSVNPLQYQTWWFWRPSVQMRCTLIISSPSKPLWSKPGPAVKRGHTHWWDGNKSQAWKKYPLTHKKKKLMQATSHGRSGQFYPHFCFWWSNIFHALNAADAAVWHFAAGSFNVIPETARTLIAKPACLTWERNTRTPKFISTDNFSHYCSSTI